MCGLRIFGLVAMLFGVGSSMVIAPIVRADPATSQPVVADAGAQDGKAELLARIAKLEEEIAQLKAQLQKANEEVVRLRATQPNATVLPTSNQVPVADPIAVAVNPIDAAIAQSKLLEGMTLDQAKLALGNPKQSKLDDDGREIYTWLFTADTEVRAKPDPKTKAVRIIHPVGKDRTVTARFSDGQIDKITDQ